MPRRRDYQTVLGGLALARLLAAALTLAAGVGLGHVGTFPGPFPLFALAVAGLLLSGLLPLIAPRAAERLRRAAVLQVILDTALVTAVVATSGGIRSVFAVLYVLVVIEGCCLFSRGAGLATAGVSGLLYLLVVWAQTALPLVRGARPMGTTALDLLTLSVNVGMLPIVALLTGSVAERYRAVQERLAAKDQRLSDLQVFRDLIFESVGSGLIALDPDGRITAFNQAAEAITGVPAAETVGRRWETVFGQDVELEEARQAAAGPAGQSRRYEIRLARRDGREVPMGISFWLLRSGQGGAVGLIGVCQDLSVIKQMEERVRQADRLAAVGRLSANIAHEIRNPLASLSAAIEALGKDLPPDPGRSRLLDIVARESDRLNRIITDFLEYARPAPVTLLEASVSDMLDDVLVLLEHRVPSGTLKVVREYATLRARLDAQQMRQALWNLCLNAVESMPEGGELRVGAQALTDSEAGGLRIRVADTGHGIADADLPHVFEPFYSTKPGGSGIGLALVYRVVQDHGGTVEVQSRPGAGTAFTLTLPGAVVAAP
jgi:two-component system, NtrC family, sensor histidine kinase PilS